MTKVHFFIKIFIFTRINKLILNHIKKVISFFKFFKYIRIFFSYLLSYLFLIAALIINFSCAPGGTNCDEMTNVSSNYSQSINDIFDNISYGGFISWQNSQADAGESDTLDCAAVIHHHEIGKIKVVTAFHCVRDISLARVIASEPDDIKLKLIYNIKENACSLQGKDQAYVEIPLNKTNSKIDYLTQLDESFINKITNSNLTNSTKKQKYDHIIAHQRAITENFTTTASIVSSRSSAEKTSAEKINFIKHFDQYACATDDNLKSTLQTQCQGSNNQSNASYCEFHNNSHYQRACFLYSDLAILEIEITDINYYKSNDVNHCFVSTISKNEDHSLWKLDHNSDFSKKIIEFQNSRINVNPSQNIIAPAIDLINHQEIINRSQVILNQGTSDSSDDDELFLFTDNGLNLLTSFRGSAAEKYTFDKIAFSKGFDNMFENKKDSNLNISSFVSSLIKRPYGLIMIYNSKLKIDKSSSGSMISYDQNILATLTSINNEEFSGNSIRSGSSIVVNQPVNTDAQHASIDQSDSNTTADSTSDQLASHYPSTPGYANDSESLASEIDGSMADDSSIAEASIAEDNIKFYEAEDSLVTEINPCEP